MKSNYIFKFGYNYFLIIIVLIITNYKIISTISYKNNNDILLLLFVNLLIILIVFFRVSKIIPNNIVCDIINKDENVNTFQYFKKKQKEIINEKNELINIGIIPDGNRRWCKKNNLNYKNLVDYWYNEMIINSIYDILRKKDILNELTNFKYIKSISLYISSIDNLSRKDGSENLSYDLIKKLYLLSQNIEKHFKKEEIEILQNICNQSKLNIIGDINLIPEKIKIILLNIQKKLQGNKYIINIAIAYDYKKDLENYGNDTNKNYTRDQEDIDLVFRSGNERRISGFFPTKTSYSELLFSDTLWPDITLWDIDNCIAEYFKRSRRFGK